MELKHKSMTTAQALRLVRRGSRIFIGSGCAEPLTLAHGLIENAHFFADNVIVHILTQGEAEYVKPEYAAHFRHNAFFIGANVREAVQEGRADYTPIFLSEIPELFLSRRMPLDAALIQVSPPDAQGFCSLGVSVDIVKAAAKAARVVIAEVNAQMPRTFGDSFIHLSEIDALVESDRPIREVLPHAPDAVSENIARRVARLVCDGATLQMGIGAIPDAVLGYLHDKNDLGVHTEMFSDGLMRLAQNGNVTGARKTLHPDAIVTSFCMGTRALYDWVHENPHVLFHPSDYTNDPGVIRQNDNMVAINGAIAVDLTGQVCADSIGSRFYSGIGGQVDFMRGAAKSKGGRPIIALPSTAKSGTLSRIVPALELGAGVVTSRGDVHYVVTEYGIASLHGKSIAERALALIEIAHPKFRDELLEAAKARKYVHHDIGGFPLTPSGEDAYPAQFESAAKFTHPQKGEVEVFFRPARVTDERRLQDFFYSHTEETVFLRYGLPVRAMPHGRALSLVQLDYESQFALLGFIGSPGDEQIVAVGRLLKDEATNLGEVAFVVHEEYRHLGVGSHLLKSLIQFAKAKGLSGLTAQVLDCNVAMRRVFEDVLGAPTQTNTVEGETTLVFRF